MTVPSKPASASRYDIAETLTGACVLLASIAVLTFAFFRSGIVDGSSYRLLADFDHIDGLGVGADVRIAGVKVGSVTDETLDPKSFLAIVSMTVQDGIQLPVDTGAVITSDSPLGVQYISLSIGGDVKILAPGQTITITQSAINLEQLLSNFISSASSMNSPKRNELSDDPKPLAVGKTQAIQPGVRQ
jgi:phospholipid/cholesterol/gamma-HCH transport system substrate-binding protein